MKPAEIQRELYRFAEMIGAPTPSMRAGQDMVEFFNRFQQGLRARLDYIYFQELIRAERLLRAVLSSTEFAEWRIERYKVIEEKMKEKTKKFRKNLRWTVNSKSGARSRSNSGKRDEILRHAASLPPGPTRANTIATRVGTTAHEVRRVLRTEKQRAAQKNGPIGLA